MSTNFVSAKTQNNKTVLGFVSAEPQLIQNDLAEFKEYDILSGFKLFFFLHLMKTLRYIIFKKRVLFFVLKPIMQDSHV